MRPKTLAVGNRGRVVEKGRMSDDNNDAADYSKGGECEDGMEEDEKGFRKESRVSQYLPF